MIKSQVDDSTYFVQNVEDKQNAANMLATIKKNLLQLNNHLMKNIDKFGDYKMYILRINSKIPKCIFLENTQLSKKTKHTSYSINKGEKIVFCLRDKETLKLHNINVVMYVAIHELSHIACPEVGHTQLFTEIFQFLLKQSIEIGIYKYVDYSVNPEGYCGMIVEEKLI